MRESVKALSVVVFAIAAIVTALAWFDDRPNQTTWLLRTIPIGVGVAALGVFGAIHFRKDLAPDFLYQHFGDYFDRNGFCFSIAADAEDAKCVLRIFFQNRHEGRCQARVAIRRVKFIGPQGPPQILVNVDCPGGAFGYATQAIAIPPDVQGKKVKFDVGADIVYPDGKGATLRFRDGIHLRRNSEFVDVFARTTSILGLVGGMILFHRPPRATAKMPSDVATHLDETSIPRVEIVWQPILPWAPQPVPRIKMLFLKPTLDWGQGD